MSSSSLTLQYLRTQTCELREREENNKAIRFQVCHCCRHGKSETFNGNLRKAGSLKERRTSMSVNDIANKTTSNLDSYIVLKY